MTTALFILLGIAALSILVVIHEFGHFFAARWMGVRVEAFSVGWGPVLFRFRAWDTEFRLSLLPLGGYCKMQGEGDLQKSFEAKADWDTRPGSFFHVASWRRLVISAAGPVFNFASALLLLVFIGLTGYTSRELPARVFIEDPLAPTPANRAGLQTGDTLVRLDGREVYTFEEVQGLVRSSGGRSLSVEFERGGQVQTVILAPEYSEEAGRWIVGIAPYYEPVIAAVEAESPADRAGLRAGDRIVEFNGQRILSWNPVVRELGKRLVEYPLKVQRGQQLLELRLRPELDRADNLIVGWRLQLPLIQRPSLDVFRALGYGWQRAITVLAGTLDTLIGLFRGKNLDRAIAGPIQTTYTLGQATAMVLAEEGSGYASIIQLFSFLSLVLFLMNLLPIPGLDGGHILFSLVEIVRRKRLSPATFLNFQRIGVAFILAILVIAVVTDIFFVSRLG